MPKILIHGNDASQALARGVKRLAAAVEPTLGPKGMNAMVDRPIGTPPMKMHSTEYSLDNINTALDDFKHRRFTGRGVIVP